MHKLLKAANEAVEVAKCDHDLVPLPSKVEPAKFYVYWCSKCEARIYKPVDDH